MKISLKKLGLSLTVVAASTVLASCGNSSNPIEKYNGVKLEDKTNTQAKPQTVAPFDLFYVMDAAGKEQQTVLTFTEGQSSQVLIRIAKKTSIESYTIEMVDFSSAERPTLTATKEAGVYSIQWSPRVGTIPDGQTSKQFNLKLQLAVTAPTSLQGLASTKELTVMVNRTSEQPSINVRGLENSTLVTEGTPTYFTVDVVDSSNSPKLPSIAFDSYNSSNPEAYRADVVRNIEKDKRQSVNPTKDGNTYRFYYALNIDKLPLDRDRHGNEVPAATKVEICFLVQAKSGVGIQSGELQKCAIGVYAVQPATLSFVDDAATAEVKAGVEAILTVKMNVEHSLSVITVSKPESMISKLTGTKEISCSYDVDGKKNQQTCVIKWTPACVSKNQSVSLTVNADATLDKKTKSSSITKTMTVIPNTESCAAKPAAVKGGK